MGHPMKQSLVLIFCILISAMVIVQPMIHPTSMVQLVQNNENTNPLEVNSLYKGSPGPIIGQLLEQWALFTNQTYMQSNPEWEYLLYQQILEEEDNREFVFIVDDEGDGDYRSIQQAVDAVPNNSAVLVYSGMYSESICIRKSLSVLGISHEYGMGNDTGKPQIINSLQEGIIINASLVSLAGFQIHSKYTGILVKPNNNDIIIFDTDIEITGPGSGIIASFTGGKIQENTIYGNNNASQGINSFSSKNLQINQNNISLFNCAINLSNADSVYIMKNTFQQATKYGILFSQNIIQNVTLIGNNFINNTQQVEIVPGCDAINIVWSKNITGNFWDTYQGSDDNDDGIGDSPYSILADIFTDSYPFISPYLNVPPEKPLINTDEQGILCGKTDERIPVFAYINDKDDDKIRYKWIWGQEVGFWSEYQTGPLLFEGSQTWNHSGQSLVSMYQIQLLVQDETELITVSDPYEIHIYDLSCVKNPILRSILDTLLPSYFLTGWQ